MVIPAHFSEAPMAGSSPRAQRRTLLLEAEGALPGGEAAAVLIHNISASGMLIETADKLTEGETLTVELPLAGSAEARIVWVSDAFYGCRFERPLPAAVLSAAQLRSIVTPSDPGEPSPAGRRDESFSTRLHRLRVARGLSLDKIAHALGVSKPTVWAWEQGRSRPVENRIAPLAGLLGVNPAELMTGQEDDRLRDLLGRVRKEIADAYGTGLGNVRIMIEL